MKYTIINKEGNICNIIEWDGTEPYPVAEGFTIREFEPGDNIVSSAIFILGESDFTIIE